MLDPNSNPSHGDTQPNPPTQRGLKNFPRWIPLLLVVVLLVTGTLGGYAAGMGKRYSAQNNALNTHISEQFKLGQQAFAAGQYDVAKLHYDFVMKNDPNYPGIQAAYTELLIKVAVTPSPDFTLTPTITATPDMRGAEEQFQSAWNLLKAGDWNGALRGLDSLRKIAPGYQTAQVDGLYYTALYQRGFSEIRPADCHNSNLNAGINDLTRAEHYGPLDSISDSLRTYARFYIAGSAYWDQDWKQAQEMFSQVMAAYPNLMDSNCTSASERWRQATIHYADQLADGGDVCGAEEQYNQAFSIGSPLNEEVYPRATQAHDDCSGSNGGGNTDVTPIETPTPGTETPTPNPTETPTP